MDFFQVAGGMSDLTGQVCNGNHTNQTCFISWDISNEAVTNPYCMYLLCIPCCEGVFKSCDIVFSKWANPFTRVCPFCNFEKNKIYVFSTNKLFVLAKYLNEINIRP